MGKVNQLAATVIPWARWGVLQVMDQTVIPAGDSETPSFTKTFQLVNVEYKRPDSWTVLLGFRRLNYAEIPPNVRARFTLALGVGQINLQFPDVWTHTLTAPPDPAALVDMAATTKLEGPAVAGIGRTSIDFDRIPAQSLQIGVTIEAWGEGANTSTGVEVFSLVAPQTHIRPEWVLEVGEFGSELGGT